MTFIFDNQVYATSQTSFSPLSKILNNPIPVLPKTDKFAVKIPIIRLNLP